MNRRGFIAAMLAAAAAPAIVRAESLMAVRAAPEILLPQSKIIVIDQMRRLEAMHAVNDSLAEWWARRFDALMAEAMLK